MGFELARVHEIAERVAASLGLEVVEVEMRGAGNARMLRIYVDRPVSGDAKGSEDAFGVTHEDCANLSREVSTILDVEDAVPGGSYVLEVSSPGLDRKLAKAGDFERFVGSRVKVATRTPVNGSKHFSGKLESFIDGRITLNVAPVSTKPKRGETPVQLVEIELANIEKANLVPEI
jgi:ribosome maturation factor RimP